MKLYIITINKNRANEHQVAVFAEDNNTAVAMFLEQGRRTNTFIHSIEISLPITTVLNIPKN